VETAEDVGRCIYAEGVTYPSPESPQAHPGTPKTAREVSTLKGLHLGPLWNPFRVQKYLRAQTSCAYKRTQGAPAATLGWDV
jgi:hypothetical protein